MSAASATAALLPEIPLAGVEYGVVARVCLPDWTRDKGLAPPTEITRAITIRKMALSLGMPPETMRRRANLLIDLGLFASSAKGLSLAVTPEGERRATLFYLGHHDLFLRLIEDIALTCDFTLKVGGTPAFSAADVIERAIDTLLLPIDTFRPSSIPPLAFFLWAGFAVAAVRRVAYDPVLCRRYANEIPPDDVRSAVSLRAVASTLSIPYATAWRQMQVLESHGLLTRMGSDKWAVLKSNILTETVREIGGQPSALMLGKVRELALLGLDPARASGYYLAGRPPLADLGVPELAG